MMQSSSSLNFKLPAWRFIRHSRQNRGALAHSSFVILTAISFFSQGEDSSHRRSADPASVPLIHPMSTGAAALKFARLLTLNGVRRRGPSMLDVHAPHEAVHGWRDFFIHLATITIGLLIALGLEGCVEWMHHRNLVKEVEVSLHNEIRNNSDGLAKTQEDVRKQQEVLARDVAVLKEILRTNKQPP